MWEFTLFQYASVVGVLFAGGIVQGAIGFAAGVFGIPLMLFVGLTLPQAVAINLISAILQNGLGAYTLRHGTEYRDTIWPIIIRLVTLPLGTWALFSAQLFDPDEIKQIVGFVLVGVLVIQWVFQVKPQEHVSMRWTVVAFGASGFLAGFCGMGGPLMAIWVMAHDWKAERSRGFFFFLFLTTLTPQALVLLFAFGNQVVEGFLFGFLVLPISLSGGWLGLKLGSRLKRKGLRQLVYMILMLVALRAIATPFFSTTS